MVMNLLSFCLSDNGLLSPSFLKYIFSGYWILNWKLCFFCALQTSYHYTVIFIISVESPAVSLILALLKYGRLNEGFPCGSADKESTCNVGDLGSFPGLGHLLISWLQSPYAMILEPPKIKSDTVSPSISHEVMGPDDMILVF